MNVLCTFYTDRMHDQQSVSSLMDGLLILLKTNKVNSEILSRIPTQIYSELNVQSYPQGVRFGIFKIFEWILTHHLKTIQTQTDFVAGFLHLMQGEKDPRNLCLVFDMILVITQHCHFEDLAQDIADSVFCYFPSTFRPPPNDP